MTSLSCQDYPSLARRGILDLETLNAMSEGMYLNLMTTQTIALIIGLAATAVFAIDLISVAWLCFSETRQPARRRMHSAPEPQYQLLLKSGRWPDRVLVLEKQKK